MSLDVRYHTTATTTGGRDGHTRTADGVVDLKLTTPKELGGSGGDGTNPEQLFAAGYSACFLSAMKYVSKKLDVTVPANATVTATVGLGMTAEGALGLDVELAISLPGLSEFDAQLLVEMAHGTCPYSNAIRGNVDVRLIIA